MKTPVLILLLISTLFAISCKKDTNTTPQFSIVGKEYAARWKVNYNNRQEYVHLVFHENGVVELFSSVEKLLIYNIDKLTYTKSGDTYNIKGVIDETHYLPKGTEVNWMITPTKDPSYEGSTIKSTFEIGDLHFVDQRY